MKTIILHGLGQTAEDWKDVICGIDSPDVECPGLFADMGEDITYSRILNALEEKYADAGEPFLLCGLSLGAILAMDFAIRHGDKVASLVLIGAQYKVPRLIIDMQNLLFRCLPQKSFAGMGLSKSDTIQLCRSMRALDLTHQLGEITCPAKVVCGERDRINRGASKRLADILPRAQLRFIPGAGHEVNKDAPQAIAEMLNSVVCGMT